MKPLIVLLGLFLLAARVAAGEVAAPLGVVYAGEEAFFDLAYRNEGKDPVAIRQVRTTCDCVTVLSHPDRVAAGETVRIACVYRSAKPGNIRTLVEIVGDDASQAQAGFVVTGFVAEKTWLASPAELRGGKAAGVVLVDVRPAGDFAQAHPPRAFNLPAFAVKSQSAWRDRPLVLLDEGLAPEQLLAEVQALRAQGFKDARMLVGGLAAWVRSGGVLEGPGRSPVSLATVSAARFGQSSATNPWQCLQLGGAAVDSHGAVKVVRVETLAALEQALAEKARPPSGGLDFNPVLLVLPDATLAAQVEQRFARQSPYQLYYLQGGAEALAAHVTSQAALAHHTGQTFVSQSQTSRPVVSGRCGSCGR